MSKDSRRRRRFSGLSLIVVLAALVAFAAGFGLVTQKHAGIAAAFHRLLTVLGQPQLAAYQAQYGTSDEKTNYLVFFYKNAELERNKQYLTSQREIEMVSNTIFSNGIVIALTEPADGILHRLRALPSVWMVLKDRPFFFCH